MTYKPHDINMDHMISGITPSTPSRISTSSYFITTTMTMTPPREQTTETDTKMGEKYFSSLNVIFYCMICQYREKLASGMGCNRNNIVRN